MENRNRVFKYEQQVLQNFFGAEFVNMPELPNWVTEELLRYWGDNIFYIHYIPKISLDEKLDLPLWKDRPSKVFYKKLDQGKLKQETKMLPGKWILIDGRDKPAKKAPWIRINDVLFLQKLGFNPKKYLQQWNRQLFQNEYLADVLKEKGFGSRFCLNIYEINNLKPHILSFLKIDTQKVVRLPFFAEYNYLGNSIYKQWRTTETWEWFEDKFDNSQYLAGGSESVGCVGWEPPEFWSTILTFRPVVEL
ncbi:MAG: hypothetical protein ABIF17_04745 [Patescibacteria group bacterium]